MKILRRSLSIFIILSIAVSMTACTGSDSKKSRKKKSQDVTYPCLDVLDLTTWKAETEAIKENVLAEVYKTNDGIINHDAPSIAETIGDDEAYSLIADTVDGVINNDTLSITSTDASIDITYTIADYNAVITDENNLEDSLTFYNALNKATRVEISVTYNLTKNDSGEWEISNLDEITDAITPYKGLSINFAPVVIPAKVEDGTYVAKIDYKSYFDSMVEAEVGKSCSLEGSLYVYLYLTIDDGTASISLDETTLRQDIESYVTNNEEAIVKASTGVSIGTAKIVTGMSYEEIHQMVMDTVMGEVNTINFGIFSKSGPYRIEGDTIIITDTNSQKEILGTVSGNTITLDLKDYYEIDNFIDLDLFSFVFN